MADADALEALIAGLQALNSNDQPDTRRLRNALNALGVAAAAAKVSTGSGGLQTVAPLGPTVRATAGTPTIVANGTSQPIAPAGPTVRATSGTVTVSAAQPSTGQFRTSGADILDRSGNVFIPIGANVGLPLNFGDGSNSALGHSADAVAWGWNILRLTLWVGTSATWMYRSQNGFTALVNLVNSFVAEYTAAGIVVMIEAHDSDSNSRTELDEFWAAMADAHKTNDRVWFNFLNEYEWSSNTTWQSIANHYYTLIRTTHGAPNIIVCDVMNAGNDQGWDGAPRLYSAGVGTTLSSGKTNFVYSLHDWAGNGSSYFASVRAAGLPMLIGECGININGISTASGDPALDLAGWNDAVANAVSAKVGLIAWHATHTDGYSLKNSGSPFFGDGSNHANLSPMGNTLWNLVSHSSAGSISPAGPTVRATAGTVTVSGGAAGSSFGWFDFNGTTDIMTFPLTSIPSSSHASIAAWFKIEGTGGGTAGPRIVQIEDTANTASALVLGLDGSSAPYHIFASTEASSNIAYGSSTVATYSTGTWYFVVAVFDATAGTWSIMVGDETTHMATKTLQAVSDGRGQTFTGTRRSGGGDIGLGNRSDGLDRGFNGKISGVAVWDGIKVTLAQAESLRASWATRTGPGTPMISSALAANPPSDDSGNGLGTGWTITTPTFGTASAPAPS